MELNSAEVNLHSNILQARKGKGYSQSDLGELLGVSRQTISNWENGQSVPDVSSIKKLEQYLDIPVEELLGKGATREALESSSGLTDDLIAKHLAKLTTFYALELERRKKFEEKLFVRIRILGFILLLALIFIFLTRLFLYPSKIEIEPIVQDHVMEETATE